jgi:hypothetical protein
MAPCTPCPVGRTTKFDPAHPEYQDSPLDCFVEPGNGVFNSSFNVTPSNNDADFNLSVLACPVGSYSDGGSLATVCSLCTTGYSTVDEGTVGSNNSACTGRCSLPAVSLSGQHHDVVLHVLTQHQKPIP